MFTSIIQFNSPEELRTFLSRFNFHFSKLPEISGCDVTIVTPKAIPIGKIKEIIQQSKPKGFIFNLQ